MSQYTYLTGVEVINDLYEPVSDIEIISVVSTKGSGGGRFLSYAFNWSTVDTMASSGNWERREKIHEFGKKKPESRIFLFSKSKNVYNRINGDFSWWTRIN